MKLEQLLLALAKRGATQAALRAGSEMQIFSDGSWRPQAANMTNDSLDAMIAEMLPAGAREDWAAPDGRTQLELQGFSILARKSAGQVQIAIKSAQNAPMQTQSAPQTQSSTSVFAPAAAPAPSAPAGWFYIEGAGEVGPIAHANMNQMVKMGSLGAQTLVWREGMSNWEAIGNTELASSLPVAPVAPPIASPTGGGFRPGPNFGDQNTSGTGEMALVPPGVGGWSWGAFFFPLFWAYAHNQSGRGWTIVLTNFIPFIGNLISLFLTVTMALDGNNIAWKHRRWDSIEHMKKVQTIWMYWGLSLYVGGFLLFFLLILLGGSR